MSRALRVDLSWGTILKILGALAAVWLWLRLWWWILLFVAAVFLAIALDPAVTWLDAHGVPRRYAGPLIVFALALILVAFGYFAGAKVAQQSRFLGDRIAELQREIGRRIPAPLLNLLPRAGGAGPHLGDYVSRFGRALVTGLFSLGVALVLTIYLLLDGRRTYAWLVAFAPRPQRPRVRKTAVQARTSVIAYVRGNLITSVLAAIFTCLAVTLLEIPAALLLAILAFISTSSLCPASCCWSFPPSFSR